MLTRHIGRLMIAALALAGLLAGPAEAAPSRKPNIVVIWGDDVGFTNLSVYSRGVMGYRTPNIDRIANEGAVFTDHYAHPSCTAGRAAFITGMYPIRTGLTSVGMVGGPVGLQAQDATLAEVLKTQGYATGHTSVGVSRSRLVIYVAAYFAQIKEPSQGKSPRDCVFSGQDRRIDAPGFDHGGLMLSGDPRLESGLECLDGFNEAPKVVRAVVSHQWLATDGLGSGRYSTMSTAI